MCALLNTGTRLFALMKTNALSAVAVPTALKAHILLHSFSIENCLMNRKAVSAHMPPPLVI